MRPYYRNAKGRRRPKKKRQPAEPRPYVIPCYHCGWRYFAKGLGRINIAACLNCGLWVLRDNGFVLFGNRESFEDMAELQDAGASP